MSLGEPQFLQNLLEAGFFVWHNLQVHPSVGFSSVGLGASINGVGSLAAGAESNGSGSLTGVGSESVGSGVTAGVTGAG